MRVVRWMWCAALAVILVLLTEPRAYAYTDPGSGALLWQTLVAAFIGAGFYFRKLLFHFISKKKIEKDEE
ncbi:MAG TPA: hypothetical protein VGQ94_01315 [Terriglobales bacterium]|nr:hypothetical protein [Terriglobales bacterium]